MRKIILQLAISLDGFIEGPNGEYDWCLTDQDYGMNDFLERIDSMFIGRKSYELTEAMGEEAMAPFSNIKTYVFSNTLAEVKSGAILVNGDIETTIRQIKRDHGKDIWLFGGASLTASLINKGLIDEISLAIHPIILRGGKLLFNTILSRTHLTLIDAKTYSTGLVSLTYSTVK